MLIDVTSFTRGPRQIENAVETQKNANQIAVSERINGYIEFYRPEFLRRVVGEQLGMQIAVYSETEHEEPDESLESLIGLLKEPFADYVFFHMLRDMNVQPTITGLVRLKCANDYVSPLAKGVQTWNRMVSGLRRLVIKSVGLGVEGASIDKDMLTEINTFNL